MQRVYLGLGSNQGDSKANLKEAIQRAANLMHVRLVAHSSVYRTSPQLLEDQPWFFNMVAAFDCSDNVRPEELLVELKGIEAAMGRGQGEIRYGPRVIDMDILLFGDLQLQTSTLQVPHPRITERAFVLVPLAEIAPDLPVLGQPVRHWLAKLDHLVEGDRIYQPAPTI